MSSSELTPDASARCAAWRRAALTRLKALPKLKRLTLHVIDITEADVEKVRGELARVDLKWD
ncbi:hypothetical protein AYO44_10965 [Planctomycetaceae bacterium SCGC AG-212-F19]|nr:hypothetical protein AYO44_10965 [Planctomycetaceae bacterium SCGC AG-212-F19]